MVFRPKLAIDNGFTHDTKYLYNLSKSKARSISRVVLSSSLKDGKECVITPFSQKSLYKLTDTFYFITKEPDSYVCVKEGPFSVGKIVLSIVHLVKIILSLAKSSSTSLAIPRPSIFICPLRCVQSNRQTSLC